MMQEKGDVVRKGLKTWYVVDGALNQHPPPPSCHDIPLTHLRIDAGFLHEGTTYLNFFEELRYLVEVEAGVNWTVHTLHGQWLVGSQRIQVGEVWF